MIYWNLRYFGLQLVTLRVKDIDLKGLIGKPFTKVALSLISVNLRKPESAFGT